MCSKKRIKLQHMLEALYGADTLVEKGPDCDGMKCLVVRGNHGALTLVQVDQERWSVLGKPGTVKKNYLKWFFGMDPDCIADPVYF